MSATGMLDSLWAIYSFEQIGSRYMRQLDRASFMAVVEPLMQKYAPTIYDGGNTAQHAVYMLFDQLAEMLGSTPLAWQRIFRDAFDRGEIDGIALGAAVRMVYTGNSPEPRYRGDAMGEALNNLRLSDPTGIMLPSEADAWRALPNLVTIYRGALTYTAAIAAQGISWSLSHGRAAAHLYRRTLPMHAATDVRKVLGLETPPRQLIAATVPKSAILAVIASADKEVFVDYERIDPAGLKSLPTNALLSNAVMEAVQRMGVRLST